MMLRFLLGSVLCCKEAITKEVEIGAPASVGQDCATKVNVESRNNITKQIEAITKEVNISAPATEVEVIRSMPSLSSYVWQQERPKTLRTMD